MTTDLEKQFFDTFVEKQFFDTFGIEPKPKCAKPLLKTTTGFCKVYKNCVGCDYNDLKYPKITDRTLLELICIINEFTLDVLNSYSVEELRQEILNLCINEADKVYITEDGDEFYNNDFIEQIQTLFKQ